MNERPVSRASATPMSAAVPVVVRVGPDDDPTGSMTVAMFWGGERMMLHRRAPMPSADDRFVLSTATGERLLTGDRHGARVSDPSRLPLPVDQAVEVLEVVWRETVRAMASDVSEDEAALTVREAVLSALGDGTGAGDVP